MDAQVRQRQLLAKAIRDEMQKRGWIQSDLVARSGISAGSVSNLLRGQVSVSPLTMSRLAACFNWSAPALQRLFYGEITEERELQIQELVYRLSQLSPDDLARAIRILDAAFAESFQQLAQPPSERSQDTTAR